ncbi:hypothetical protein ACOTBZ_26630 [Achromobacter xylosoxidans]|uniref:hypothetical protein n=1 Tax=Achromobacter insuavis TaxID=1287735 RepID=UPI0015D262D8|nr:hypothetical protein [Achromobacter insuavis]
MDPIEFVTAARQLIDMSGEGALRSAVSRAYYGALHICNAQIPVQFAPSEAELRSEGSHNAIIDAMEKWGRSLTGGRSEAQMAARKIVLLKRSRVKADYRINQSWDVDASKSVRMAEEIAAHVAMARSKWSEPPGHSPA